MNKTFERTLYLLGSHLFFAVLAAAADEAEKVDLDAVRNRYWARGEESEVSVVQNRQFSKAGKFDLGVLGGSVSSDPFLSVSTLGGSFGYHFSEYVSFHLVGWKHLVSPSTALRTFEETLGATTNNNPPRSYVGGEVLGSLLYGKLSVIGKAILYYDLHASAGLGMFETETGTLMSPSVGIGQQIHLSQNFSLRVDYRLQYYRETIVEKVITPRLGQVVGQRDNWSNNVTFGLQFRFGGNPTSEQKK